MADLLPKWITKRYILLWRKFGNDSFSYEDAKKLLKEKDERMISIALSALKRAGWVEVTKNPDDKRKGLYKLKYPDEVFKEVKV